MFFKTDFSNKITEVRTEDQQNADDGNVDEA